MKYPNRLLPKANFRKISWCNELSNQYLIHSTITKENIDPVSGKLNINFVVKQTDHLKNYSNNLLGVFLIEDVFLVPEDTERKDYFIGEWKEGSEVIPPLMPLHYKIDDTKGYFFLRISDCHNKTIKFEDDTFINPVCLVLHTPCNANFWHFSLRWYFDGVELDNWTDGIKRRMKFSAKTFIVEKAFFEEPFFSELDSSIFSIK